MKSAKTEPKTDLLIDVAKAVGKATGTVAALIGRHPASSESEPSVTRRGKLVKKKKSRTPRRMKKTMKKQAAIRRSA